MKRAKIKRMKRAIKMSLQKKTKRSTGRSLTAAILGFYSRYYISLLEIFCCVPVNECTVGKITQVTIREETFPFDYDDVNQLNYCLNATIVKNNLASIISKVDQDEFQSIVLSKLKEVGNAG